MKKQLIFAVILFFVSCLLIPIMLLGKVRPAADYTMIQSEISNTVLKSGRADALCIKNKQLYIKIEQQSASALNRGTYILRLNENMEVLATYHFPWYVATYFGISDDQELLIYVTTTGILYIYDKEGKLIEDKKEIRADMEKGEYCMVFLTSEKITTSEGITYQIDNQHYPFSISRMEENGSEVIREIF